MEENETLEFKRSTSELKEAIISIVQLSKKVGIAEKNIEVNIKKLKQAGILKRIGPAKGGHWEVKG